MFQLFFLPFDGNRIEGTSFLCNRYINREIMLVSANVNWWMIEESNEKDTRMNAERVRKVNYRRFKGDAELICVTNTRISFYE